VDISTEKKNAANVDISAKIGKEEVEKRVDKIAAETGRKIKVDGFRKGKVPPAVVKKLYGEQLIQDAETEVVGEMIKRAYEEAGIDASSVIGDPIFRKYDKSEEFIEVEMTVCLRPEVDVEGYGECVPSYEVPEVSEEELNERLQKLAEQSAKTVEVEDDRGLEEGDIAVFDFTGYIDDEPFEGGKAENYELEIGSGQFIPGFEEQMKGMKKGESKSIEVTFPEDYQAENLKGKKARFDIVLHAIKEKKIPEIDDELAKSVTHKEDATLETLKKQVKEQIATEKLSKLYNEELKQKLLENLIEKFDFDLPENIVEQEIDNLANQKASSMSKEEIEEIRNSSEKLDELRDSVREDAQSSVKATFIVDAVAKAEDVKVDDQEVTQALYYEAIMTGQDPEAVIKYYQQNNLLPAIKMGMIEDRLFAKLLDLDNAVGK
jgi:trigger factor